MALVTKNDVTQIFAIQAPAIDLPPTFANYPRGWDTARSNNGKPTIKQFNYIQQRTDQNMLWIHQNGAALPYDATMEYAENAVVVKDGELQKKQGASWVSATNKGYNLDYFISGKAYPLHAEIMLVNGDIVKSTVSNNAVNPNIDMTGWVKSGNIKTFNSIADLLNIRNPADKSIANAIGYYINSNVGGGKFLYSSSSVLVPDNGIVFDCPDGGKWIRLHKGTVSFDDYGAKRDGTDQSVAIENCISNIYCRCIEQESGEFIVSRTLKKMLPRTNIKMHPDSLIKIVSLVGGVRLFMPADDSDLQLQVDGNQYPLSGNIQDEWVGVNNIAVASFADGYNYGYGGNYNVKNVKITNSKFVNIAQPIRNDGAMDWLIVGNYFENIKQSCCLMGASNESPVRNNKFSHNTSINIGDTACATFQLIGNTIAKIKAVQMTNNFAINTQMRTMGCSFDFEGVENVGDCTDGLISGNIVIQESQLPTMDTVGRGGVITGANVSDTLISNNIVVGKGLNYGIVVSFSHNVSILGNMVRDFPGGGISILGTTGSIVAGNTLTNCGSSDTNKAAIAVMTQAASVLTKDFTVRNNTIEYDDSYIRTGTSSAICVDAAGSILASNLKSSIDGNKIFNPNGAGISIISTNSTPISGITLNNNKVMSDYEVRSFQISNAENITVDGFYSRGCQRFRISNCLNGIRLKNLDIESTVNAVSVITSTRVEISDSRLVSPNGTYFEDASMFSDTTKGNKLTRITGTRRTENKGKHLSGATGVTIPHGLVLTPEFIELTWLVSGITSYHVSDINATNFKVNFVGAASADLMWKAEV